MSKSNTTFSIEVEGTENRCPIGETIGNRNMREGKIPVISCEGACIRGEIARLAANIVAKDEAFARGCHGELLSVPDLTMLDVMMETWQDGFEMARILKKDPDLKDMPILMLTGVRDQTGIDFKETAGDPTWLPVDGYLEKPVEPNALLAEVERLLTEKHPG